MRRIVLLGLALSLTTVAAVSFLSPEDAEKDLRRGQGLMAKGLFKEAAVVLEGVEGSVATSDVALEAHLLRVKALLAAKDATGAATAAQALYTALPDGHAARGRARYLLSDALRALGKIDDAARHYEALCSKLLSDEDKARVASYTLALAEELAKGKKSEDPLRPDIAPDPKAAASLYREGLALLSGGKPVTSVTLPMARAMLASNDPGAAVVALDALLKQEDIKLTRDEEAEARYRLASALLAAGILGNARKEARALLSMKDVDETAFAADGRQLLGETWARQAADATNALEAARAWDDFLAKHPAHPSASAVRKRRAQVLLAANLADHAIKALALVTGDEAAEKEDRAWALFETAATLEASQRFDEAGDVYRSYLARFPDDRRVPDAQQRLPELLLAKARSQLAEKQPAESIKTLEVFLTRYPLARNAPAMALEIGRIQRQMKQFGEALLSYGAAMDRYRQHAPSEASMAGYAKGVILEEDQKDLEAAINAYRQVAKDFPGQPGAQNASRRITTLEGVELSLAVDGLFAPKDQPKVKLALRNIAKATFRLYRIKAKRLFEEKGSLDGMSDVEVALVKADHTFTFEVPDYRRYRHDAIDVPMTLADQKALGEGAWLVSVETEDRRAVVPLIISSVRLVVKESPNEVFVWAVDADSGAPLKGVEVHVRGNELKKTLTTDDEGVARLVHEKARGRCRVLGVHGASVVPGMAKAPQRSGQRGLAPRVAFTLERPIHRPGNDVAFHAVLRDVTLGSFTTPEAETEVFASLADPSRRTLGKATLKTGPFGTVNGRFSLPEGAPLGNYTLSLEFAGQTFVQRVEVKDYKLPEYRVAVSPKKTVVPLGEGTDVDVLVTYFFGGAVKEAPLQWRLFKRPLTVDTTRYESHAWYLRATGQTTAQVRPDASWQFVIEGATVTDREGKATFPVTNDVGDGTYEFLVQATVKDTTGQWVGGSGRFATGPWDRFAVVLPQRQAWRTGETAEVRIVTRDLLHGAVATQGRLKAQVARTRGATSVYETVTELDVSTGLTGEATLKVPLTEAGDYRLLFEGETGAAPVVAAAMVIATGETPDLAKEARLVFERKVVKEGDVARMHLQLPRAGRPVLLTFEGERVLEYRIVTPKSRSEVMELTVGEGLAPNVTVAVATPYEGKLLTASDELVVLRYLQVSVSPDKDVVTPGTKVALAVATKDQNGRPVAASIVLKAVDQALEDLASEGDKDPRFVFNQDVREHLVRTGSSFDFAWSVAATLLDQDLRELRRDVARLSVMSEALSFDRKATDNHEEWDESAGKEDQIADKPKEAFRQQLGRGRRGDGPGGPPGLTGGAGGGRGNSAMPAEKAPAGGAGFLGGLVEQPNGSPAADPRQDAFLGLKLQGSFPDSVGAPLPLVEPELRGRFEEVAGWWPALVTDDAGQARVTLETPDNLTTWSLVASGSTMGTAVGRGTASVLVQKDVMLRLDRPRFLTSRDEVRLPAVVDSNLSQNAAFRIEVSCLDAGVLEGRGMTEHGFEVPGGGQGSARFSFAATGAGRARLRASARSTIASDALEVGLPVVAFGEPWRDTRTAELRRDAAFKISIDDDVVSGSENYRVLIRGGMEAEVLLGLSYLAGYPYGCLEQTVHRFVPAMEWASAVSAAGRPTSLDLTKLPEAVARGLLSLFTFQRSDGGFSYWSGDSRSDPWATALATHALVRASALGYAVDAAFTKTAIAAARRLAMDAKVDANARAANLLAIPAEESDASVVQALFRQRTSLSVAGLARLFVAAHRSGATAIARTLQDELIQREIVSVQPRRGVAVWPESELEGVALKLWALEEGDAPSSVTNPLVEKVRGLLRMRHGSTKAVAAAIQALQLHVKKAGGLLTTGDVVVAVDGKDVAKGRITAEAPLLNLTLPVSALTKGAHLVTVRQTGQSVATCDLILEHVRVADEVAALGNLLEVERRITAYRDPDAKSSEHAPGFEVVRPESRPKARPAPSLFQTVAGDRVTVELTVKAKEDVRYLVIRDPLIAGLEVIESGVRGSLDRFERRASAMIFFNNHLRKGSSIKITYPCYAVHEGRFFGLPAMAEEMYRPETFGRSASLSLEVVADQQLLARIAPTSPTPDELYARGTASFAKEDYKGCLDALADLPKRFDLRDDIHDELLRLTWIANLRLGNSAEAVRAEETLRLRNPRKLSLGVADKALMGQACLAVGESELALQWFQSVTAAMFDREVEVASRYNALGRLEQEVAHLQKALLRFPPWATGKVHRELADLFLRIPDLSLGAKAALLPPARRVLWKDSLDEQLRLMAWYSGEALAENAWFDRIGRMEQLELASALVPECAAYLERFPNERRCDTVQFRLAGAAFDLADYKVARDAAKGVWDFQWPRIPRSGTQQVQSNHRFEAGYLLGKMAHVEGDYEEAVAWYGRVKEAVPDAAQSWLFFTEKELAIDPVVRSGATGDVKLLAKVKNVAEVETRLYPVDLLVLFAVKKSFDKLATADLSGVEAARDVTTKTSLAKYAAGTSTIDLGKLEPGAYLVSLRAEDRAAGTLLLVSDARLTLQRGEGAVRAYLVDGAGKPIAGASVRLAVGTRIFHSGETDVRGMLSVNDPGNGTLTAVAVKADVVAVGTHP